MQKKLLVGITAQENSRRLIEAAAEKASLLNAPLHIIHIRKGNTIFDNPESSLLLQELFSYGGELGGEVHFLCSDHVTQTMIDFITENGITDLLLGEPPIDSQNPHKPTVAEKLETQLTDVHITFLPREEA